MAQNITLLGASYSDVPAVTLPKTGGGTASFTDVTDTTATAADVASGKYFYTSSGVKTEGTASGGGTSYPYSLNIESPRGGEVTPKNGNNVAYSCKKSHVYIKNVGNQQSTGMFMNLTDIAFGGATSAGINSKPEWFKIPTGTAVLSVSNVTNTSSLTWNINFRKASASSSLSFGIGDGTHTSGDSTTVNVTAAQSVGCLFVYFGSVIPQNAVLEFDISFTVNGVRYF